MRLRLACYISIFVTLYIVGFSARLYPAGLKQKHSIHGKTMGTFYHIVIYTQKKVNAAHLKQKIDVQLNMLNSQMSLYIKSSEISKFNKACKGETIKVSRDFYKVMKQAKKLYLLTDGAWDGTIRVLLELWNFDRSTINAPDIPGEQQIKNLLGKTGFDNIIVADKQLIKKISGLSLDLGSIAKGYGVDVVTRLLKGSGYKDFFVEIGGEVYVAGKKGYKKKWKLGIVNPKKNSLKPYKIIKVSDKAVATSGTYLNFLKINGKVYSHIINPKTGWPVDNKIISVSVIAQNCMIADGLATGLMVMGRQKGIDLVESLDNVECMILIKNRNQPLEPFFSKGFVKYLY